MRRAGLILLAGLLTTAGPADAQRVLDRVSVHAFGGAAYGQTTDNQYVIGVPDGAAENFNLGVSVTAELTSTFRLSAQVEGHRHDGMTLRELDYALAEWRLSDEVRLRGGKVKHPFGLFSEVYAVGTIRPFYHLAQGLYGPSGLISEGYKGVGLTGVKGIGGWELSYDGYYGRIGLKGSATPAPDPGTHDGMDGMDGMDAVDPMDDMDGHGADGEEEHGLGHAAEAQQLTGVVGGRVELAPSMGLWRVGVSAYTGQLDGEMHGEQRALTVGAHAELFRGPWTVRAEAARGHHSEELTARTAYLEVSRRLTPSWELGTRYGVSRTEVLDAEQHVGGSALEHSEVSAGVNHWVSPQLVLRLSYHLTDGNRFAVPVEGDPAEGTRLVVLGAEFSF